MLAYCRRRASVEVAEEATAEAFLVVWRRLEEVPSSPWGWVLGIARRTPANHRRGARRREALLARLGSMAEVRSTGDHAPPLLEALASLPELDQEALLLTAWEGLSSAEAAQVLGCSAAAYRVRLYRARRRLERALQGEVPASVGLVKEELT